MCLHEVIREMTMAHKAVGGHSAFSSNPIVSVADPMAFNENLLKARSAQYNKALAVEESVIFFDRGLPDVLAYMDCFGQVYGDGFVSVCETCPYDLVFLMPPWKEIHRTDDERFETFEESLRIHACLLHRYSAMGYAVVTMPRSTVSERVNFILEHLNAIG